MSSKRILMITGDSVARASCLACAVYGTAGPLGTLAMAYAPR